MKIGELSRRTGFSIDTIRYYERIGLLPKAFRAPSGHRDYDASTLTWIAFLERLKTMGMPIRERLEYAELRSRGVETEPERKALLERHREKVRVHIAELQNCLSVLDDKITGYAETIRTRASHDRDSTNP